MKSCQLSSIGRVALHFAIATALGPSAEPATNDPYFPLSGSQYVASVDWPRAQSGNAIPGRTRRHAVVRHLTSPKIGRNRNEILIGNRSPLYADSDRRQSLKCSDGRRQEARRTVTAHPRKPRPKPHLAFARGILRRPQPLFLFEQRWARNWRNILPQPKHAAAAAHRMKLQCIGNRTAMIPRDLHTAPTVL